MVNCAVDVFYVRDGDRDAWSADVNYLTNNDHNNNCGGIERDELCFK